MAEIIPGRLESFNKWEFHSDGMILVLVLRKSAASSFAVAKNSN
jgi:hypothetical protein